MKDSLIIGIFIFVVVCLCCVGVLVFGGLGLVVYQTAEDISAAPTLNPGSQWDGPVEVTSTPEPVQPEPPASPVSTLQTPLEALPSAIPIDTLLTLELAEIPVSDLWTLTRHYKGLLTVPETLEPPPTWYQVGAGQRFWVTNVDTSEYFQIQATLHVVTEHAYFWVEDGVSFRESELADLADTFENQIYPTNRAFFGSEWSPGIDGDPHIYIVYASGLGSSLAGYFSSADSVHPVIYPYSNGHEMFLFNSDTSGLNETYTYGVLAHEFQHMIHWYQDRNEASWLTEGFSELATFLNGLYIDSHAREFTAGTDIQLNSWPDGMETNAPYYGASFLFVTYFLDRFGDQATQALVKNSENSLESIDDVLAGLNVLDALRESPFTTDDVFQDWTVANYLQDETAGDGRFDYHIYDDPPKSQVTESIRRCPVEPQTRTVNQYGTDYIRITCQGSYSLTWTGMQQTGVISGNPHSGRYALWSNQGDESVMTLTRTFDFSGLSAPLTLSYWAWYDLEKDFDYLYLSASLDGQSWQILSTPSGTAENPSGNSFGWGYTGTSGGGDQAQWIEERVDLSAFAGQVVQIRFEYVTDGAVYREGFLLDDLSVPELGYTADFEAEDGGWTMSGWVRMENILPQTYRLTLIRLGDETRVEYIPLGTHVSTTIPIEIGAETDEIILVVSGTTRFTRLPTTYHFEIR